MANDNRPYGITKLRELWPDKWAVGALFKTPSGGSLSFSTDLPKELAEEIMDKMSWYAGGHEWKKWRPKTTPASICDCERCRATRGEVKP